jgi:hypothetical protein
MYHSTTSDFEAFDTSREALGGAGSWFSVQPGYRPVDSKEGARVMPVYLSLQNPKVFDFAKESADYRKENLVKQGYDGVVITINGELKVAVAFKDTQIKSATGNRGTYDESGNINENVIAEPSLAEQDENDFLFGPTRIRERQIQEYAALRAKLARIPKKVAEGEVDLSMQRSVARLMQQARDLNSHDQGDQAPP